MSSVVDFVFEVAERIAAAPSWAMMRLRGLNTDMMPAGPKKKGRGD